ncbi:MAG: motility protein A [Myxococcales bacterium]|nr:motility protein A [Myxococcales bacterium]
MDLATIIGLATAFALIIGSMLLGGSLSAFFNVPGLLIVVGGTFAAAFVNQRMSHVLGAFKVMMQAFFDKSVVMEDQIPVIIGLAQKARKEGLVALEGENIEDEFLARGVRLGVDGLSPDMIKATLTSELAALKRRHERGQQMFKFMESTAPAMGMIGTLIGLVQMLQTLSDPSAIGPAMAGALLNTLYGAILAFVIFGPIATKLEARTNDEVAAKRLAITGVESILKGDNTMLIQSKLEAYLSPDERGKGD